MTEEAVVGVTGAGSLIGQAIIKSVVRSKTKERVHLVGFDPFEDAMGLAWVDEARLLPNMLAPEYREDAWLDALMEEIRGHGIQVLLVGLDFELPVLARQRELIHAETGCQVVVSDPEVVAIADDKYLTARFLDGAGLAHPATWLPDDVQPGELPFPVVVKPRHGARSRGVSVVTEPDELPVALGVAEDPVIQELVGSDDEEYTCGVICFDGLVERSIALRRTLSEGNTRAACYSRSTPRVIYDYLNAAAEALRPLGACNFQLRLGADGVPRIFEINARHSGTTYIRSLFGYREVEYVLARVLGWPLPEFQLREGCVRRYFDEMFVQALGPAPGPKRERPAT